jgi:hypothetical protein
MKSLILKEKMKYTGAELAPHFIYRKYGLLGDSILAFVGEAEVKESMVDIEDIRQQDFIYSPEMLSFIIEHFGMGLSEAVARQRLFMSILKDVISRGVIRTGDDLFHNGGKLSVSIATVSPVSSLIHVGLNVKTKNTPVKTSGLEELGLKPLKVAEKAIKLYIEEDDGIKNACCKVIPK